LKAPKSPLAITPATGCDFVSKPIMVDAPLKKPSVISFCVSSLKPIFQFVAAEAVVAVIAPNEKTIVADNAAARIFVLILFVFFMMVSPLYLFEKLFVLHLISDPPFQKHKSQLILSKGGLDATSRCSLDCA
jgi:hypothetical protein